jgi:hypothetical protein
MHDECDVPALVETTFVAESCVLFALRLIDGLRAAGLFWVHEPFFVMAAMMQPKARSSYGHY